MKINRNMSAVLTNKQLLRTENKLQTSMERLSSGFKINSAGDNPAGMAISNKMKEQIDALNQAESNANDGVSVLQIADGALNEVASILQRMRELSVEAAGDTKTFEDKQAIQDEINQLVEEVDRISSDTEYNTKKLLDGSSNNRVYANDIERISISENVPADKYGIIINSVATKAEETLSIPDAVAEDTSITINGVKVAFTTDMTRDDMINAIGEVAEEAGVAIENNEDGTVTVRTVDNGADTSLEISLEQSAADFSNAGNFTFDADSNIFISKSLGTDSEVSLGDGFGKNATVRTEGNRVFIRDNNGFKIDFRIKEDALDSTEVEIEVTDIGKMAIQVGANQYQEIYVDIPEVSASSLYLDTVNVVTSAGADKAITTLDEAIAQTSSVRSRIGASQNRLEYATRSLSETQEDMTAAYSRILDTDMAEEMTEYAQQNVLDQATISVLAQANDLPQQILSLLQ